MIGSIVGSYKIVASLGAGGMAEVFLAEHTRIHRRAAVKVLLPEWLGTDEAADRFLSEARSTSAIRHPGIVEIFDCGVHEDGRAYMVMELLEGESLAARLARDPAFADDIARPLRVAGEVADALAAAHRSGIIHRDLKPENVFLTSVAARPADFGVKVLDFGIAKLQSRLGGAWHASPSHTLAGTVLGTPAYMSPEQCNDAGSVDHRADIYSLGCILFEMLSGRPPFVGTGLDLLLAHVVQAPPLLHTLRSGVPPRVDSLVSRLLAKKAPNRPASMDDVRDELAAITGSLRVRTTRKFVLGLSEPSANKVTAEAVARAIARALAEAMTKARRTIDLGWRSVRPVLRSWRSLRTAMWASRFAIAIGTSVLVIAGSTAVHRARAWHPVPTAAAPGPARTSTKVPATASTRMPKPPSAIAAAAAAEVRPPQDGMGDVGVVDKGGGERLVLSTEPGGGPARGIPVNLANVGTLRLGNAPDLAARLVDTSAAKTPVTSAATSNRDATFVLQPSSDPARPSGVAANPPDVRASAAAAERSRGRARRLQQAAAAPTPRLSDDERKL